MKPIPASNWFYPSLFDMPASATAPKPPRYSMHVLRAIEDGIISARMQRFRKIIKFVGKSLDPNAYSDFESLAMNKFFRDVRLHIGEWHSGSKDNTLTAIAKGARSKVLKSKYSRDSMIKKIARK